SRVAAAKRFRLPVSIDVLHERLVAVKVELHHVQKSVRERAEPTENLRHDATHAHSGRRRQSWYVGELLMRFQVNGRRECFQPTRIVLLVDLKERDQSMDEPVATVLLPALKRTLSGDGLLHMAIGHANARIGQKGSP